MTELPVLQPGSFTSSVDPLLCPGCGDYSVLAQVKKALAEVANEQQIPQHEIVILGPRGNCHNHVAQAIEAYLLQGYTGYQFALAQGLKIARPELKVWIIAGEEAVGRYENHFSRFVRDNFDVTIIIVNDQIKAVTKGQSSPTTPVGVYVKGRPHGNFTPPIDIVQKALADDASFVARSYYLDLPHMQEMLRRAGLHKGCSIVEIYNNCNVFAGWGFREFETPADRRARCVYLEHGKPLVFGESSNLGLRQVGFDLEVVELGQGISSDDLVFHDEKATTPSLARVLANLHYESVVARGQIPEAWGPLMPEPFGVFRAVSRPTYEELAEEQKAYVVREKGTGELADLQRLFESGETFTHGQVE